MSALRDRLDDYVALRRSMGFVMKESSLLVSFVRYMDQREASQVTTDLAVSWAVSSAGVLAVTRAQRLGVVRAFSVYLHALDPAHEVPPVDLLPGPYTRITPYIYSEADIAALMAAASSLPSSWRALTYRTLIGLLAVSGMRLGEAIRLDRTDLDQDNSVLVVRDSKFSKSREIPLHPTTLAALAHYQRLAGRHFPQPNCPALLVSTRGTRLIRQNIEYVFPRLVRHAGLKPRSDRCHPRLYDFRHSLAVNTLLDWYRQGLDVQSRLPLLSTLLGHTKPANTYWYLSAVPELLALVAQRRQGTSEVRS
jgi:integrase/recombinase XerD